jgi:hypothetical protein
MYSSIHCLANKNAKSNIPCGRNVKNHSHLCGLHKKSKNISDTTIFNNYLKIEYNLTDANLSFLNTSAKKNAIAKIWNFYKKHNKTKHLDEEFSHYLVMGESSWKEIPDKYRYNIKGGNTEEWWDIRFLIGHFTQQLNNSKSGMPSPKYPFNPFTKIKYSPQTIRSIYQKATECKINIHLSFGVFIELDLEKMYGEMEYSSYLVRKMRRKLRFKMINSEDSEGNYLGHWVDRGEVRSEFEKFYEEWDEICPLEYDLDNNLVNSRSKSYYKEILNTFPEEMWDLY